MTRLIPQIVGVGLLVFAAAACRHTYYVESTFVSELPEEASRVDEKQLEVKPGDTVEFRNARGSVTVEASKSTTPYVRARITARGKTKESAEENLKKCEMRIERGARGIVVSLESNVDPEIANGVRINSIVSMKVDAAVPEGSPIAVETGSGDVRLRGPLGASDVNTKYGKVEVNNLRGDVKIRSGSGSIDASGITGAQTLDASSGYGNIKIVDCEAARLEADSGSGEVSVEKVNAKEMSLKSNYGKIEVARSTGALAAKTSSGSVAVSGLTEGSHAIETGYGNIYIRDAAGSLRAKTSSGEVRIESMKGQADATSNYGNIKISGVLTSANARSSSGNVHVEALEGSVPQSAWSLTSGYGSVTIEVPENFRCLLDAKTSYGSVDTDFAVLLEPGSKLKSTQMRGVLNPGSEPPRANELAKLTASTSSGNIKIKKL